MKNRRIRKAMSCMGVIIGAALLVGCQAADIGEAEAFARGGGAVDRSASSAAVADADRKFLAGPDWSDFQAGRSLRRLVNVDPADRKFYGQDYLSTGSASPAEAQDMQVHPADVKFLRPVAAVEGEIHPADIKFLQSVGAVAGRIHPADVKFYNPAASTADEVRQLYLSLHPADRKFLAQAGNP